MVIGGGIAGAAAAIALRKAGIEATVFEARPEVGDYASTALRLPTNGLHALRALDAYLPVAEASVPVPWTGLRSGSGRRLGTVLLESPDGEQPRVITRAGLARVLREQASERGATIELGRHVVDVEAVGTGVRVHFACGSSAEGDVVIGADGVNSVVRAHIDPNAPEARYCGTHIVYGYTGGHLSIPPAPDSFEIFWGAKATFAYTTAATDIYWWASIAAPAPLSRSSSVDIEYWRTKLCALFRRDRTPATAIIGAADVILPTNVRELRNLPRWHNDNAAVIGDAAHPVIPATEQGAALAIEDAVMIGRCLRDEDDPHRAFKMFEDARRQRVEDAAGSRRTRTAHRRGMPRWIERRRRDRTIAEAARRGDMSPPTWLHNYHIDWDNRLI